MTELVGDVIFCNFKLYSLWNEKHWDYQCLDCNFCLFVGLGGGGGDLV